MRATSCLAAAITVVGASCTLSAGNDTTTKTLFVSHYDGHIYTLTLDTAERSLTLTDSLETCGNMPSWLTYDSASRTLYCVDETGWSANFGNGSLSSYTVSDSYALSQTAKTTTLPGGVASVIYNDNDGGNYLAIAHYQGSALSNFALPISDNSPALQHFEFTLPGEPTVPARQDAAHPHETFVDPKGEYVLVPDLGSDRLRIFAIQEGGELNECDAFAVKGGNGPRHGAWWTKDGSEDAVLYISNELANTVSTYNVTYGESCLVLEEVNDIVPYPQDIPSNATMAEVHVWGNKDVYVSLRNEQLFSPNDTIAFLTASDTDGSLTYENVTPSYGKTPRTFAVNKAGTFIAIGNEATSDIAIVERDPDTGAIGSLVAQLQFGATGTPGVEDGLSSVIWVE